MAIDYKPGSFLLNGRNVAISEIINNKIDAATDFEKDIFEFIKNWFSTTKTFHFQSSGSTGRPKIIKVSREQIKSSIKGTALALNLNHKDTSLICLPLSGTGGKMMLARSILLSLKMICIEPTSNPFNEDFPTPSFTALTPYQLEKIIKGKHVDKLNSFKAILVGGAPVNEELKNKINKLLTAPVYATYGMTETVSHIALQLINTRSRHDYFQVLPGIYIKTDERNCLMVKGPVTKNIWITTNDIVEIKDHDKFNWIGRFDNIINSGGVKIQPEVVEDKANAILSSIGINRKIFVYGLKHENLGEQCNLFIEGTPVDQVLIEELKQQLRKVLPPHHAPGRIHFIPQFAFTASGKINRRDTIRSIN